MTYELNMITWNARGIRNKSLELYNFLNYHKVDICLVTETWLNSNISIKHKDFIIYRNDREIGRGGGVAIIIKKNTKHSLLPIVNTHLIENIGVKIYTDTVVLTFIRAIFQVG